MATRRQPRIIPVNHFSAQALRRVKPGKMSPGDIKRVFGPPRFDVHHDGRELRFSAL